MAPIIPSAELALAGRREFSEDGMGRGGERALARFNKPPSLRSLAIRCQTHAERAFHLRHAPRRELESGGTDIVHGSAQDFLRLAQISMWGERLSEPHFRGDDAGVRGGVVAEVRNNRSPAVAA